MAGKHASDGADATGWEPAQNIALKKCIGDALTSSHPRQSSVRYHAQAPPASASSGAHGHLHGPRRPRLSLLPILVQVNILTVPPHVSPARVITNCSFSVRPLPALLCLGGMEAVHLRASEVSFFLYFFVLFFHYVELLFSSMNWVEQRNIELCRRPLFGI